MAKAAYATQTRYRQRIEINVFFTSDSQVTINVAKSLWLLFNGNREGIAETWSIVAAVKCIS